MTTVVTRAQWGARAPRARPAEDFTGATAHWEGPTMGVFPHASCPAKVRGIQAFHMDGRGWSDIAYNYIACPHGYLFEGRGRGVRSAANGTNAGNDADGAVCYLGGVGDPFTEAGAEAMAYGLWLVSPGGLRHAHRDWKPTTCPGDTIAAWVHSPAAAGPGAGPTTGDDDEMLSPDAQKWLRQEFSNQDDRIVARVKAELLGTPAEPTGIAALVERNKRKLNRLLDHFGLKHDDAA